MLPLIIRYTKSFRQGHNLTLKRMVSVLYVLSFSPSPIAHIFALIYPLGSNNQIPYNIINLIESDTTNDKAPCKAISSDY